MLFYTSIHNYIWFQFRILIILFLSDDRLLSPLTWGSRTCWGRLIPWTHAHECVLSKAAYMFCIMFIIFKYLLLWLITFSFFLVCYWSLLYSTICKKLLKKQWLFQGNMLGVSCTDDTWFFDNGNLSSVTVYV